MKRIACLLLGTILSAGGVCAAESAPQTAITIYSKAQPGAVDPDSYRPVPGRGRADYTVPGYAVIRQSRPLDFASGDSQVRFSDVAALLDPTTVLFKSLSDPDGTKVAEQDYRFDLVSQQKLLEKYIDRTVTVEMRDGGKVDSVSGTLLAAENGLTLKLADGTIRTINNYSSVTYPDLPGGLITKPTLVWRILTEHPGKQNCEVSYETQGITWWADYNLVFREGEDANSGSVDFGSWVSIINRSGAAYQDAKLKLVAGDVQRAPSPSATFAPPPPQAFALGSALPVPAFNEKAFFEYHLYTLNQPVTLADNSTKQMELIPAVQNVPVEKTLVYSPTQDANTNWYGLPEENETPAGESKVKVYLKLKNSKENGLGIPLPAGRVRVNQRDEDGALEFIGENVISHTAKNEDVSLPIGSAFDVTGSRRRVDYALNTAERTADETIELTITNHKKSPVKVTILEELYRMVGWTISAETQKYTKDNAGQIRFLVNAPPEKPQIVSYHVHYHW